jgi:hypothetical protein
VTVATLPRTQKARVLDALRRVGSHGLTAIDFSPPHVIDGGAPITRVAARIEELRAGGHKISSRGRRSKCVVYVLEDALRESLPPVPEPAQPPMFQTRPTLAIFDYEDPEAA